MAEDKLNNQEGEVVPVPLKTLAKMQEQMAEMERKIEEESSKRAGLEAMLESGAKTDGEPKLREKKSFEPKFRTVRVRKYPIAGDVENMGYIVGWTSRGAYQEVDRTGASPQMVDFIDVIFLGQEKTAEGKIKAEKIRLLDLMNKGIQVHCKIVGTKVENRSEPTGEEIDVSIYDPQHGLITTGEKVDGFVTYSDRTYTIQIPGVQGDVEIDGAFLN